MVSLSEVISWQLSASPKRFDIGKTGHHIFSIVKQASGIVFESIYVFDYI
jgi:hypothetical protein